MAIETSFNPDWASPPGDTVAAVLRERKVSSDQFCTMLGRSKESVDELLDGQLEITEDLAELLSEVLGGSKEFWSAREAVFRAALQRLEDQVEDESAQAWVKTVPFRDMAKLGWVRSTRRRREQMSECLRFFGVSDVESWGCRYRSVLQNVAMRTSRSIDSDPTAVAAWFRQGEIEASRLRTANWNTTIFEALLADIRLLTREADPAVFVPSLVDICAAGGVSIVVLRAPKGCRASGATRFVAGERPMILLSGRHLSEDHFWFTFFHEAAHLILHGDREFFLDFDSSPLSPEEAEANSFAEHVLIPAEHRSQFLQLRGDLRGIARFARRIGLSAGVVIGQLQYCEVLQPNWLNTAKRRYAWDGGRLVAES
jgi:Zn-dependent peptidase ImmA (M78 family)/plasmid maintenance system antidote protein VapI